MTPAQYRVIRFLTNLSFYIGLVFQLSPEQVQNRPRTSADYFAKILKRDWESLVSVLHINDKTLCGIFHGAILNI